MTSEIRANTLKNRVGLGTISFTNTGPVVSGIVTAEGTSITLINKENSLNTLLTVENTLTGNAGVKIKNADGEFTFLANERLRIMDEGAGGIERVSMLSGNVGINSTSPKARLDVNGNVNIAGVCTATTFSGAFTGTASGNPTLTNGANDRVITATGANAIQGESNFTYNGTSCTLKGTTDGVLNLDTTDSRGSFIRFQQGGTTKVWVGSGQGLSLGDKDDLGLRATDNILMMAGSSEKLRIAADGKIKFATSNSNSDYFEWFGNPRLYLKVPSGTNGLRIDSDTTPLEIRNSSANGRSLSFGSGGASNFDIVVSGDYSLSSSGYDSTPKLFFNTTRHNGSTTVTSFQCSIQGVATSNTNNTGYLGLGASASPDDLVILTNGNVGINSTNPDAPLTLYTAASAAWKFRINTSVSDGAGFYQRSNGDFEMVLRDASNNNNYIAGTGGGLQFTTSGDERLRINSTGQLLHTANKSSEYTARFVQAHADNPAWLEIDSPADNNLRPAYIQFKNAGTDKWGIGQVYNPTGGQSFHISNGTHNQTNSQFVIMNNGDVGVNVTPAQASKFCAYAASGTTAAFLKSNTGASIALGGLTQPRILLEAHNNQSDLQIYTAGGSSWGTPTWSKKATFTSAGSLVFSNNQNLVINNSYTDGNMTIGANVGTNAFTAIKGSNHTRIENYSTVGSASWIERFRVYTHGYYHEPVRHADSVETKNGGRYYVISGATPLDGDYDDNTYTPLMRCGHSFNGTMYLWLVFNGDEYHRGCSQHIIMCQGTYGYVSNSTRRSHNQNALGTGMGSLEFAYQNSGTPNYYFKVRATWTNGENQPYVLWTWVGHNSAYPYAL